MAELRPQAPAATESRPSAGSGRLADGVSTELLGLWIDLVRQGDSLNQAGPRSDADSLTQSQLLALACVESEGLTMGDLAHTLNVSRAVATSIADRLTAAGATVRFRDGRDRRLVRLVATEAGVQLLHERRREQVATLQRLLERMAPARQAVLSSAMKELARSVGPGPWADADDAFTSGPERWALH